jgi:anti-sigma-K factor RskA
VASIGSEVAWTAKSIERIGIVKYQSEPLRDALAAEYALGTLQGSARRRFERSLKDDPRLRRLVTDWQSRLAPLDALAEPVQPPARVWNAILDRIQVASGRRRVSPGHRGFWGSLTFWRGAAIVSALATVVLAVFLATLAPTKQPPQMMVVVMSNEKSTPGMTVSWPVQAKGEPKLRIRVMGHETMTPDQAWELWMVPGGDQKPVSLGLINTDVEQELRVPRQLMPAMNEAWGLAMSVEPRGGSPTGLPTGPVMYKGQCVKL